MDINSLTHLLQYKIEHFDEVTSTNTLLRERLQKSNVDEGLVVVTANQTQGRGQLDTVWESTSGKNLLCSVLLQPTFLKIKHQTYLNMALCLAMFDTINKYTSEVNIKWPNDIYINKKKTAGILIENILQGNSIKHCIAGIGININQTEFNVPTATSLKMETQGNIIIDEVLVELLNNINKWYGKLVLKQWEVVKKEYHKNLLGLNKTLQFKNQTNTFTGVIKGVDEHGRLMVEHDGALNHYLVKEISML
jgi:BirA family biotin operon repressor/biotin-[acetyl-CoA-carboxylase] ligase